MASHVDSAFFEERGNQNCDYTRNYGQEKEQNSNSNAANMDILNKINALLDNSLDLSNFSSRRSNQEGSSIMEALGLGTKTPEKPSPYKNAYSSIPSPEYASTPFSNFNPPPTPQNTPCVNTLNFGDKKYPDVSLPLRKILQNSESYSQSPQSNSLPYSDSPSSAHSFRRSPSIFEGSPTLEQALLMGCDTWKHDQSPPTPEQNQSSLSGGSDSILSLTSLLNNLQMSGKYSDASTPSPSLHRESPQNQFSIPVRGNINCSPAPSPVSNGLPSTPHSLNLSQMRSDLEASPNLSSSLFADKRWATINSMVHTNYNDPNYVDKAAKLYRNAAAFYDATCTWSGQLPPRQYKNPTYSCKVFLGGVPWDITETGLVEAFAPFGQIRIQWPGKDNKHPTYPPKGYVYILFETEKQVKSMLQACTHDCSSGGNWYFRISSRRMRSKEVQVIPWVTTDSNFVRCPSQRLDPAKTVFVGALHGMLNAEGLAHIMNDLFGGVVYAGIDTDKYKYPIGSGRVTFNNNKSYMKAVAAAFVEIKTAKFTKKVQVDPYLEDSVCSSCSCQQGPYFCRDVSCFKYYCRPCWQWQHSVDSLKHHKPLMRNTKTPSVSANTSTIPSSSFHQLN